MAEPVILPRMTLNHRIGMEKEGRKYAQKRRKISQLLTELRGVLRGSEGVDEPMESIDGGVDLKYSRSHRLGGVLLAVDQLPPGRQATARFQILKAHLFFLSTSPPINPQPPAPPLSFPGEKEETSPRKKGKGPEKRQFAQFAENSGELRQI